MLKATSKRKAWGPDNLTIELITGAGEIGIDITTTLLQKIWLNWTVPQKLKQAHILLIPKTSPPSKQPELQRPITLLNLWYKILDKIIKNRIQQDIDTLDLIADEQAGFRPGKSCQDQVFILETIADLRKQRKNKGTYWCLIDLKKAFDSVSRQQLYDTMRSRGVETETVAMLAEMWNNETSRLLLNGNPHRPFEIKKGVR